MQSNPDTTLPYITPPSLSYLKTCDQKLHISYILAVGNPRYNATPIICHLPQAMETQMC